MSDRVRRLILASGSPRRRELLERLGFGFGAEAARIEETPRPGETPRDYALRVAAEKCENVSRRFSEAVVLSADTVVSVNDAILGKPSDPTDAVRMLESLSGRIHWVYTSVVLASPADELRFEAIDATEVWFRSLGGEEIDRYVETGEVMDKAGAYAIQGGAGEFVPRIRGNYSNVVGLPLPVVFDLFRRLNSEGVRLED